MAVLVTVPGAVGKTSKAIRRSPLSAGPFPVGVITTVFGDTAAQITSPNRSQLVTEIWYPATDDARRMPKNKYSDFNPAA